MVVWSVVRTWLLTWANVLAALATAVLAYRLYILERRRLGARLHLLAVSDWDEKTWYMLEVANIGSEGSALRDIRVVYRENGSKRYTYAPPHLKREGVFPDYVAIAPGEVVRIWARIPARFDDLVKIIVRPVRGPTTRWVAWREFLRLHLQEGVVKPKWLGAIVWRVRFWIGFW